MAGNQGVGCFTVGFVVLVLAGLLGNCGGDAGNDGSAPKQEPEPRTAAPADKAGDLAQWINRLNAPAAPCEKAGEAMGAAMANGAGPYRTYALADEAEGICDQAQDAVKQVAAPTWLNPAAAASASQSADACSMAMLYRKLMARKVKELVDGGMKPSAMREAQLAVEDVKRSGMRCAVLPIKAALDEGIDAKAMADAMKGGGG